MLYEYPKEFVVPIAYDEDLKSESSNEEYRENETVKWGILEITENELNKELIRGELSNNKSWNGLLKKQFQEYGISNDDITYSLEDENSKKILASIDDEYAIAETGSI